MSPRPRIASDFEILAAVARIIGRAGLSQVTFTSVGREVGMSGAAVMQRFGSKRGLLLAAVRNGGHQLARRAEAARAEYPSSLDALMTVLGGPETSLDGETSQPAVLHRALLQFDLTDPGLFAATRQYFEAERAEIQRFLAAGIAAGELADSVDPETLAYDVQVIVNGVAITWAVRREGTLAGAVQSAIIRLLDPWRAALEARIA